MIHVSVPGGAETQGQFSPVWIEGTIELKPANYHLFLVDGSMQVKVAYTMVTNAISEYSAADSDTLVKVEHRSGVCSHDTRASRRTGPDLA